MAANSEASRSKVNLMAWSLEMEAPFIEQDTENFYETLNPIYILKKHSICYVDKYFKSRQENI